MALYLGNTKLTGTGVQVDNALSSTSTNPVENKAVTDALTDVGYSTWQKPSDWIDIRSGALPNSVYYLVGHSADYSTYPTFDVYATVSNSGTYDVYIDGIKKYSAVASGTTTTLTWQTLALTSGWDVTYPSALRTHIIRLVPTGSSNTLVRLGISGLARNGLLWSHITATNALDLRYAFFDASQLREITCSGESLKVNNLLNGFNACSSLIEIPVIDGNNASLSCRQFVKNANSLKKIYLKNILGTDTLGAFYAESLEKLICKNVVFSVADETFRSSKVKSLPPLEVSSQTSMKNFLLGCTSLENTILDLSSGASLTVLNIGGTSTNPISGLKGLVVSSEAPFTGTSPQLSVAYTGLDRSALVNLFKSMPYNVGYTVVGSPTITDGVVSGFSASDYLQTSLVFPNNLAYDNCEYQVKFTMPNTELSGPCRICKIYFRGTADGIGVGTGRSLSLFVGGASNQFGTAKNFLELGQTYVARAVITSTTVSLYCGPDENNLSLVTSKEKTAFTNNTPQKALIGRGNEDSSIFPGTIDLNKTYININGVPWFTGKAAMTKTCSVVGCTGTADLTQDDKNIALNKNWELTVA